TVVGDPLYRPFGTPLRLLHEELARRHSPLIEWSFLRLMNLDRIRGVPVAQLVNFLGNLGTTTNSAVLTEKLADFCEMQGKPSSAIEIYQLALTRSPSPEQRIRLQLTLGEKL